MASEDPTNNGPQRPYPLAGVRGRPAFRGEDNAVVLAELLARSREEIERLEREGILSSRVPESGTGTQDTAGRRS